MAIFYPLFVFALFLSTVSAEVTWSIDCGTSAYFKTDGNLILWTGDDTLISTGQSKTVAINYFYSSSPDPSSFVVNTLRAFPSGTTNCYVLAGKKGTKVQLRAMFYYGNYDGKSSPPSFGLQFDGNDWTTVETTMDLNSYLYYDVIYVTKGDNINVCLIQTNPKQTPFISAIEVRTLKSTMYDVADSGNALFLMGRYTSSTTSIRYFQDVYDRIWNTSDSITGGQFTTLAYDGFLIDTSTSSEEPPQAVVQNALTTLSTSDQTLNWTLQNLPSTPISVYLILYFSEMTRLSSTQTRAFSVYIGNSLMNSTLVVPPYGRVTEFSVSQILMSKTTVISLIPTTDSTEPPLVNAMEVFQISDYKVSYTAAASRSPTGHTPPSSSGDNTPPTSFSSGDESGSTSGKRKSKLPVILGTGFPGSFLYVAFFAVVVLMHQKRKRAAMMGAGGTGTT